jgi:acetylglutamate synthase
MWIKELIGDRNLISRDIYNIMKTSTSGQHVWRNLSQNNGNQQPFAQYGYSEQNK